MNEPLGHPQSDPLVAYPVEAGLDREAYFALLDQRAERLAQKEAMVRSETRGRPLLLLRFQQQVMALPLDSVREIREDAQVHHLPGLPAYLPGLVSRRGRPFLAIDLGRYLALDATRSPTTTFVLIAGGGCEIYLQAKQEVDIAHVEGRLEPPSPTWNPRLRRACQGILPGLVALLDPDRLLEDVEREVSSLHASPRQGVEQ